MEGKEKMMMGRKTPRGNGKESVSVLAGEDEMQQRGANLLLLGVSGSSLVILKAG